MRDRWLVTGVAEEPTTTGGGLLRSRMIFRSLAERAAAETVSGSGGRTVVAALARKPRLIGSRLAAANLFTPRAWRLLRRLLRPVVLDLYDHPVLHAESLGFSIGSGTRSRLERGLSELVADFPKILVITDSFAELSGVPVARRVVAPNGADTTRIQPGPFPSSPVVGMVSGAAPGRGIELLIDAVRALRTILDELTLHMALVPTGVASKAYLDSLRSSTARLDWVRIEEVPYPRLSGYMAATTVLAVPHPAHPHLDAALPLKVLDGMAAGRPIVATPRFETVRVLDECEAGVVAASDHVDDLAAALERVLTDPDLAHRLGANGRSCAVKRYDWRVISERVADAVLDGRG